MVSFIHKNIVSIPRHEFFHQPAIRLSFLFLSIGNVPSLFLPITSPTSSVTNLSSAIVALSLQLTNMPRPLSPSSVSIFLSHHKVSSLVRHHSSVSLPQTNVNSHSPRQTLPNFPLPSEFCIATCVFLLSFYNLVQSEVACVLPKCGRFCGPYERRAVGIKDGSSDTVY